LVLVHNCSDDITDFFKDAWCLLAQNLDIIRWLTCLIFGEDWRDDLAAKIEGHTSERGVSNSLLLRVEIRCDNGVAWSPWASPCPEYFALSWPDAFGGFMHICAERLRVTKWAEMSKSTCPGDRICALIDCAALMAHELTHIVFTLRSGDTIIGDCEKSYMFGNSVRWALLRRFPEAFSSECCGEELLDWDADGLVPRNNIFMRDKESETFDDLECGRCA
jgi:hypothetical protein